VNRNGQPESVVPNGDVSGETPAVSIRDLSKRYGSGSSAITALEGVSIEIPQRSVVGLLGPNGAGKTTALKSALGLVLPTERAVSVLGVDVVAAPDEAYRHVGAMLEGARNVYWRLTPRENLRFFASLQGLTQTDERAAYHDRLLETLGLADRADDSLNDFSRGMKQKVALAATLAGRLSRRTDPRARRRGDTRLAATDPVTGRGGRPHRRAIQSRYGRGPVGL